MSHAEEKPVILSIGDDGGMRQAAWHDPAFREAGWQHWTVEEGLRSPAAERGPDEDVRIRVRSVRRGTAVERALLQALRTGAGWVGAWFPAAGPAPSLQELEQLGFAALQADLALQSSPSGHCRLLALRDPIPLLFRELSWLQAPRSEELIERCLEVEASAYSLPSA